MSERPLAGPRLTHVALPVSDLDASLAFFTSLCDLVVVARNEDAQGRGAWLSNDGQVEDPFVLVLAELAPAVAGRFGQAPGQKVTTLAPFAHIGIELPTREAVDAVAARAREMGCLQWEPTQMAPHIGYICAALDPDGNVVEFSHDQKVFATVRARWGEGRRSGGDPA